MPNELEPYNGLQNIYKGHTEPNAGCFSALAFNIAADLAGIIPTSRSEISHQAPPIARKELAFLSEWRSMRGWQTKKLERRSFIRRSISLEENGLPDFAKFFESRFASA